MTGQRGLKRGLRFLEPLDRLPQSKALRSLTFRRDFGCLVKLQHLSGGTAGLQRGYRPKCVLTLLNLLVECLRNVFYTIHMQFNNVFYTIHAIYKNVLIFWNAYDP